MSRPLITRWQQLDTAAAPLRAQWQALGPREQTGLRAAAWVLAVLVIWLLAVQPAWRTLRQAPAQIEAVELQLQQMQGLAAEVKSLRAAPPVSTAQATEALQAASARLGAAAKLSINGDRAVLTVSGVASEPLLAWLGEVRSAARARPVEAQLLRGPQGFSGTVVLSLNGVAAR
jgi:general secretion pathway protein M